MSVTCRIISLLSDRHERILLLHTAKLRGRSHPANLAPVLFCHAGDKEGIGLEMKQGRRREEIGGAQLGFEGGSERELEEERTRGGTRSVYLQLAHEERFFDEGDVVETFDAVSQVSCFLQLVDVAR
eukprot:762521-Hanusia_phi.AAC.33